MPPLMRGSGALAAVSVLFAARAHASGVESPCVVYTFMQGWNLGTLSPSGNLSSLVSIGDAPFETGMAVSTPDGILLASDAFLVPGGTDLPSEWARFSVHSNSTNASALTGSISSVPGYPGPATVIALASSKDRIVAILANSEAVIGLGCGQEQQ